MTTRGILIFLACFSLPILLLIPEGTEAATSEPVKPGGDCNDTDTCVANATCDNSKCSCSKGFYNKDATTCEKKKAPETACTNSTECVDNASCDGGKCACSADYSSVGGECVKNALPPNATCTDTDTCVQNATCTGGKCQCNKEFYTNGTVCDSRKPPGSACAGDVCVENASCSNKTCNCDAGFYNLNEICTIQIKPRSPCKNVTNECVPGAKCVDNTCKCGGSYYDDNTGVCKEKIQPEKNCSSLIVGECVENAKCNITTKKCKCDPNYYNLDNKSCNQRIAPGDPCDGDICVGNATCDDKKKCSCNTGYFNDGDNCAKLRPCDDYHGDKTECCKTPSTSKCIFVSCTVNGSVHEGCHLNNETDINKHCFGNKYTDTCGVKPTTPAPSYVPGQHFDALSFIGGIIFSIGIIAIVFFACKVYKARSAKNYHTL